MIKESVTEALSTSERVVSALRGVASPEVAAQALALALGRLCGAAGVDLDRALDLARLAAGEGRRSAPVPVPGVLWH